MVGKAGAMRWLRNAVRMAMVTPVARGFDDADIDGLGGEKREVRQKCDVSEG